MRPVQAFMDRLFGRRRSAYQSPALEEARTSDVAKDAGATRRYVFTNPNLQIAAIGDIHGRIDLLNALQPALEQAAADPGRRLVEVYLGDYIDYEGDPKAVIEYLIERMKLRDRDVHCLAGNHERMLLRAMAEADFFPRWLRFGGNATVKSYGISPSEAARDPESARKKLVEAVPPEHVAFLRELPIMYMESGFLFVHAGVRPGVPIESQVEADLLWIREPFLSSPARFGPIVVHGHTPTSEVAFRRNRIGIDTGAYMTGVLTCLKVNSDVVEVARLR